MKSFIFSCLTSALNLYFAQKLRKKGQNWGCKNRKKLLQTPKVVQKLSSTIKTGLGAEGFFQQHEWLLGNCKWLSTLKGICI